MTANRFDQAGYWITRHQKLINDPRSVGNLAFTAEENLKGEADLKRAVSCVANRLADRYLSVLDLGCGYGRIANEFISHGFDYFGVDVSADAIERARTAAPRGHFSQANLVDWLAPRRFDVVCVLYVFVHFVDEDDWLRVLQAALASVKSGGLLFFADYFPVEQSAPAAHVAYRPLSAYEAAFSRSGFKLDDRLAKYVVEAMPESSCARQFRFAGRWG